RDVVASGWIVFWGFRCIDASYSGNVADIWDSATGSTTETQLTCSAGGTVNETVNPLATTCASGCNVKQITDQVGTNCGGPCNINQTTNANRFTLTQSFSGGRPCATSTGHPKIMTPAPNNLTGSQPLTISWVGKQTSTAANGTIYGDNN